MGDRQVKDLRKQLRQIVNEIMPKLLKEEIFGALIDANNNRMKQLEAEVRDTMVKMENRQKETLDYLIRQSAKIPAIKQA